MFNQNPAEQALHSAEVAVQATQRVANEALDSLSHSVHRGVEGVREASQQLRANAARASDTTADFIRHEPVKAVLIAAATGAALMALIGLMSRPNGRG